MNSNTFAHFGCWNQGLCGNASTPLTKVMRALKAFTKEEKPDFIVVAGDNYYPDKVKNKATGEKVKTIIPNDLATGFACLPKDVPIDMLFGNHDLETNMSVAGLIEKDIDCFITKAEIAEAIPNHIDLVVQKARTNGETLLLLIDTSMYDDEDIGEMLPCYKKIAGYTGIATKEELRAQQLVFIQTAIAAFQGENIIFIGHHPITGYKLKKDDILLIKAFPSFLAMLLNIYQPQKKYYYLCADLHLYQEGTVSLPVGADQHMQIEQYIVGTGGTALDPDPSAGFRAQKEFKNTLGETVGSYTMTPVQERNSMQEFGFLVCDFHDPAALKFTFRQVPLAGGSKKTRRSHKKPKRLTRRRRQQYN
jgi:hypothetical protein